MFCAVFQPDKSLKKIPVKFKKLQEDKNLLLPAYTSEGSSGMDIRAYVNEPVVLRPGETKLIPAGLAVSIPFGYEAQIRPRSGLALRHGIGLVNSPGTIDSDYRGEIGLIMINWGDKSFVIKSGDRVAQMIISRVYQADILLVGDLDETTRGDGGFGHTGIG